MKNFLHVLVLAVFSMAAACQEEPAAESGAGMHAASLPAVSTPYPRQAPEDTWEPERCSIDWYPCPPVGTRRYQTVEDIPFVPVNDWAKSQADEMGMLYMHDLYQRITEGKKMIYFGVTAGWCSVCRSQFPNLSTMAQMYPDVLFLVVVSQDANGDAADYAYATTYNDQYRWDDDENVYVTYDPNFLFERYMTIAAYPFNMFIDLKNMEIMSYESGLTSSSAFSSAIQAALSRIQ